MTQVRIAAEQSVSVIVVAIEGEGEEEEEEEERTVIIMPRTTAAGVTEESHLIDAEPAKGRLGDRADGSLNKQSLLGKSMLIGGVACLFMASTMGIITVGDSVPSCSHCRRVTFPLPAPS